MNVGSRGRREFQPQLCLPAKPGATQQSSEGQTGNKEREEGLLWKGSGLTHSNPSLTNPFFSDSAKANKTIASVKLSNPLEDW